MKKKLFIASALISVTVFSAAAIYADADVKEQDFTPLAQKEFVKIETAMGDFAEGIEQEEASYREGLSAYIRHVNRTVSKKEADAMVESFVKYADQYQIDAKLVMAVAQTESCYYADVVSCANYKGLMQTGDGLAENAGYDPSRLFEPDISIKIGAKYIRDKLNEFGDTRLALTAYNQGSGSVHSGNYSTGYADLTLRRAEAMEEFLRENGYVKN